MGTANTFSKPLTKAQAEYAIKRLTSIKELRIKNITGPVKPIAPIELTTTEKYIAIKNGKVKIKPMGDVFYSTYLTNAFTYPQYETKLKIYQAEMLKYKETVNKLEKPINTAFQFAVDTIMLGDAAAALNIIEKFSQI